MKIALFALAAVFVVYSAGLLLFSLHAAVPPAEVGVLVLTGLGSAAGGVACAVGVLGLELRRRG